MTHKYTGDLTNSELTAAIKEYVRDELMRSVLVDRLCNGYTYERLAEKYNYSVVHMKRKVYKAQDKLFARMKIGRD